MRRPSTRIFWGGCTVMLALSLVVVLGPIVVLRQAKADAGAAVHAELSHLGGSAHYQKARLSSSHGLTLIFDLRDTPELNLAAYHWLPAGEVVLSK